MFQFQAGIVATPERIGEYSKEHSDEQAQEAKTTLPQLKPIYSFEDQLKRTEEKIEYTQQDGGEDAEVEAHRF